jgi:hypothetical protein
MPWILQKGVLCTQVSTPDTSATTGTTASNKGAPAELIASTRFDAYLVTSATELPVVVGDSARRAADVRAL